MSKCCIIKVPKLKNVINKKSKANTALVVLWLLALIMCKGKAIIMANRSRPSVAAILGAPFVRQANRSVKSSTKVGGGVIGSSHNTRQRAATSTKGTLQF